MIFHIYPWQDLCYSTQILHNISQGQVRIWIIYVDRSLPTCEIFDQSWAVKSCATTENLRMQQQVSSTTTVVSLGEDVQEYSMYLGAQKIQASSVGTEVDVRIARAQQP